jgi:PAS domain S-box-containing protein
MQFPIPPNESTRLQALKSYGILDTDPEEAFDDLAQLASRICGTPMAAVSLVDTARQWFKARVGLDATETARDNAFCAHGIVHQTNVMEVPDAREDRRFANLGIVRGKPKINFYTGAKLANADGQALGMLCVMDHEPRKLDSQQTEALEILARQVVAQLELRRELAAHKLSRKLLESRQAELQKSENLYHSLVEHLPVFVLRKDCEGRITFANQALCDAVHRTIDNVVGKTDFDLLPHGIATKLRQIDQEVIATGKAVETVQEIPGAHGHSLHVQITTIPLHNAQGGVIGVQVLSTDFTERRRLEMQLLSANDASETRVYERTAELKEANASLRKLEREATEWRKRYDTVVASAGLAIYDIDRATSEVVWSRGAERVLGLEPAAMQLAGEDWLNLVHPQDRDIVTRGIAAAVESGQSFELQYRLRHGSEHYRWIHDRGLVVPDDEGRCTRVLGMMQDITQRKLAEDTMREQAKLLDQSQDAIMVRDLENRVLYWNQTAHQMYGWSFGEALGRQVHELLLRGELAHIPTAQQEALKTGEWSGEVKLYAKDGDELIVYSRWTVLRDHDGKPRAFLVTHTNLTDRKLLEAKFLRAQRMESVGALASGIAHDLNNVFTPIIMSAQMLRDARDDASRAKMLEILTSSAQRGSDMVKQVLTFSRGTETSGLVDLKHLVNELDRMMRDTFPHNIEIVKALASEPLLIRGDPTQLYQILINLCINARDAMPSGGKLRLEAVLAETPGGQNLCLTVSDTGTGMTPEVQRKIFEPFFTTKEIGKGTGLGLSTVQTLVKAHGGTIEVESSSGAGTAFKICLPTGSGRKIEAPAPRGEMPAGHGETILVIDDESAIREILKSTLEAHDYEVVLAADGPEGIVKYSKLLEKVALVVTDLAMPILDGIATARALRRLNPAVKVIALTGVLEPTKLEALANERITLLPKPVSPDRLMRTIHDALQTANETVAETTPASNLDRANLCNLFLTQETRAV